MSVHYAHIGSLSLQLNMVPGVLLEPYMSQGGQGVAETPIVLKGLTWKVTTNFLEVTWKLILRIHILKPDYMNKIIFRFRVHLCQIIIAFSAMVSTHLTIFIKWDKIKPFSHQCKFMVLVFVGFTWIPYQHIVGGQEFLSTICLKMSNNRQYKST